MTDAERQRDSDKIAERRNGEIEEAVASFLLSLSILTDAWHAAIDDFLQRDFSRAHPQQLLNYLESQLSTQITHSGYPKAIQDLIAEYSGAVSAAEEQLAALGIDESVDTSSLDSLRVIDSARLTRQANNTAAELAAIVIALRIFQQPDKAILESAGRSMDSFESATGRTAENGIYVFNRAVDREAFRLLDRFLYLGPADERNSPFCREHVGNIYTRDEINHMNNGQPAPYSDVWLFGGHPFCRHQLKPQAPSA